MTILISNSRERSRFLRFAVVGIIGAMIDFGVMNLLTSVFQWELVPAGTLSFIAAIASNFTWNRYWTYPDSRTKPLLRQLGEFTLVSVMGLAIRIPTLALLEPVFIRFFDRLAIDLFTKRTVFFAHNLTLAIAVTIVMFWNFFVNRYWTYSDIES